MYGIERIQHHWDLILRIIVATLRGRLTTSHNYKHKKDNYNTAEFHTDMQ